MTLIPGPKIFIILNTRCNPAWGNVSKPLCSGTANVPKTPKSNSPNFNASLPAVGFPSLHSPQNILNDAILLKQITSKDIAGRI